ncbi:LLM class flavin-dependent oxidoreductase [Mycobacterium intracellulare]|uniref:FMN-dependent oxidoreductase, nitrilotriacetate monooxygenase family protein n=1 Tax=Mycobacterium intracellulare 1956 TaxID=1299331 RepID=X8CDG2_MYCIT|nr:FMN-dependent oxidoreductase, nitrilotriacetate monooxygenase family protein [Mycobacterium intracellulare]EUA54149.1 FMN-dependent oxidoreductase, nitrilotriacetate monooxygenase family protein [Mycobacterium intracellulare 1956]
MSKRMIFTLLVMDAIGHNFHGSWRHPRAGNREFKSADMWVDLAKKAEQAKVDAFFFTDVVGVQGEYRGSRDIVFEMAMNVPIGDCTMLIPAMAYETQNIGFLYTSSVISHHPFVFSRAVSTLDHLSGGRIGWNIVTSANESAFRNLGLPGNLSHEERYAWADEYVDVTYKLWEGSWDVDAIVNDPAKGIYADPAKVHNINHAGKRYSVEGFNLMEPSPQRTPVLAQAGGSPAGLEFASGHAELMFLSAMSLETIAQQIATVRDLAGQRGRRDGDILFLQGMMFVIGSTDEEAYRKWAELEEYRSPEAQTAYFSSLSGMDLGRFDPSAPLRDILDEIPGIRGAFLAMINAWPEGSTPTVKDFLSSLSLPQMVVGSPETIAARLLEYQGAGVDGVQVMNALLPQSYDEFFEYLVPVLQGMGLMQKQYRPGTLREKLFDTTSPHVNERHPAHSYRGMFCDQ